MKFLKENWIISIKQLKCSIYYCNLRLIYKYKKTSNHEVTVNSEMNEKFLTSKDLKNTDYQFNEDKMPELSN